MYLGLILFALTLLVNIAAVLMVRLISRNGTRVKA
jgi:ABC-type phosphate transport system permease subunit